MKNHKFNKFGELGLYSSEVPHIVTTTRNNEAIVLTCAANNFYVNGVKRLTKYSVSDRHPDVINCMAASKYYVFTGCGKVVRVFKNKKTVYSELHCDAEVKLILPIDESYVIAIDKKNNLKLWLTETGTEKASFTFSNFDITSIIHPLNHEDKILLGSSCGKIKLFNVKKMAEVYEYNKLPSSIKSVICMEQSPFDHRVVAIGCQSGEIVFLNLRYETVECILRQDYGPVTCISFTTTDLDLVVVGTSLGHICVWEYYKTTEYFSGSLRSTIEMAHRQPVANITCMFNENTFITNSSDNSIKIFTIDQTSLTCSQLKERCGHYGSLSKIIFYDNSKIISTGDDSVVRMYPVIHHNRVKSFGTAAFDKKKKNKLPPIIDIKCEKARERDWEGVVAVHNKHPVATTWNVEKARIGTHRFQYESGHLTCAEIASCGNFALFGSSNGNVEVYNLQSGLHRGRFTYRNKPAHDKKVIAIVIDDLNETVVSVGDDLKVKFWNFKRKALIAKPLTLKCKALFAKVHRPTSLLAVALVNFKIEVYDIETQKVTRIFDCHGSVTDMCWSSDGSFIVTASSDCYIRTFDMSLGVLVDQFPVEIPVTSLCLSPNSALLATSHAESPAISLWSNSSMFGVNSYTIENHEETDEEMEDQEIVLFEEETADEQLAENLLTSSGLPNSRWINLSDLELIRARNKPKEAVKKVTSAPFFLDTPDQQEEAPVEKIPQDPKASSFKFFEMSPFAQALSTKEPCDMLAYMKERGPSHIDAGIRSLSALNCSNPSELMLKFLGFCLVVMRKRTDFELVQAYLNLFLKVHTSELFKYKECKTVLREIFELNANEIRNEFNELMDETIMCTNFINSPLM